MEIISGLDLLLLPIYLVLFYLICYTIKTTNIAQKPYYRFFVWGLTARFVGVIGFCLVYAFYYKGGDTISYYLGSKALINLFFTDSSTAFSIIMNDLSMENYAAFNSSTGWPAYYMWRDEGTFTVSRISVPFVFLGAKRFLLSSIVVSFFTYIGVWKLYQVFVDIYPKYMLPLAFSILFMPTLVFWGTGVMKDSYTLSSTCWLTYNFYCVFIKRKQVYVNALLIIINTLIIIYIKPYVVLSLLPGILVWLYFSFVKSISSVLLKIATVPFMLVSVVIIGYFTFNSIAKSLGSYGSIDEALDKAKIIQQDLLRESQYGSNNYYLGEIDGSISNMLSLAPMAIFTALYRPSIVEAGNPMMLISVAENTVLLTITLLILLRTRIIKTLRLIGNNPILIYSLIFSLFFAFGVGIASTNFGALVRYKTPLVPFFFSAIFIIYGLNREERLKRRINKKFM